MAHYFFDIKYGGVNRDIVGRDCSNESDATSQAEAMVKEIRSGMAQLRPNVFVSMVDDSGREVSRFLVSTPCEKQPPAGGYTP